MKILSPRQNLINDGNDDIVPGRFFYVTLIPNENNPYNVLPAKATEIYSSFTQALEAFDIVQTKVSELQPEANIEVAREIPETAIGGSNVFVGKEIGSRITLWCIDRRGEVLH